MEGEAQQSYRGSRSEGRWHQDRGRGDLETCIRCAVADHEGFQRMEQVGMFVGRKTLEGEVFGLLTDSQHEHSSRAHSFTCHVVSSCQRVHCNSLSFGQTHLCVAQAPCPNSVRFCLRPKTLNACVFHRCLESTDSCRRNQAWACDALL